MSTLNELDFSVLKFQLDQSKGKLISKEKVLSILHEKLKEIDSKHDFIVDRLGGAVLKDVINVINEMKHDHPNSD